MAVNWMDNFNIYGTDIPNNAARLLNGVYADTARTDLQADPDPTATGMVARIVGGGLGGILRYVIPTARTTIGAAARFWFSHLPSAVGDGECPTLFSFRDANNIIHIQITIDPSGNIRVNRFDTNAYVNLFATPNPVLVANAWKHVEAKVLLDNAAGSVQVRVEGITVVNISGIRTTNNVAGAILSCQNVAQQSPQDASASPTYVKDYIIWDNQGTFNNDFMGSCQVLKIVPDADVALNWSPIPGPAGFNMINQATPQDDVNYIQASAVLNNPTTNGALSATAGGALGATTYFVKITYVNSTGETLAGPETSLAVAANNVLNVAAPPGPPAGATGWNVYVSTTTGTETKQNGGVPIPIANAWVEPTTGLVAGAALPGGNTTVIPNAYKCSLQDLPSTVTSVRAVMPVNRSRKTDGGDGNLQQGLISVGSTGLGANRPITTAYTYWWDIFDADPNGSIAWTRLAVNALNLQLNRTL